MKCRNIIIGVLSLTLAVSTICIPTTSSQNSVSITSAAADVELDPGIEYVNCKDHIEITGYSGNRAILEIPETIEELPVTKVSERAFKGNRRIGAVYLSAAIEEIDDGAFEGCTTLKDVHFPPALRKLGNRAFYGCSRLMIVIIPDTVSKMGKECFSGCTALETAILPDGIRRIERKAFAEDAKLETITIPGAIDCIENDAFKGCEALTTVCYKGSSNAWSVTSVGNGNDILTDVTVLCDYNKQKVDRTRSFDPEKDSWSFMNKDVEYYLLSDEKLEEMTKGMSQHEKDTITRKWTLIKSKDYSGSCAGIAMTSLLVSAGVLDPSELDPDAQCLNDVNLTDDIRELITYYWLMQYSDVVDEGDIFSDFKLYYYLEQGIPVYFRRSYGSYGTCCCCLWYRRRTF